MQRIAVVGSGGAGKSTFSRRLGAALDLPVIHLDEHFWRPGWVETPKDEWRAIQQEMVAADRWVIDGNYGGTMQIRFAAADTVVFLDHHRVRCLARALGRSLRNRGTAVQAPGCPERLDPSFARWIWDFPTGGRQRLLTALFEHGRHAEWVWLTDPAQTERWLTALTRIRSLPTADRSTR